VPLAVYSTKQHLPKKYATFAFMFFSILMSVVYSTNVSGASVSNGSVMAVSKTFDMVVYGATPAGIMSAVAGAKQHLLLRFLNLVVCTD